MNNVEEKKDKKLKELLYDTLVEFGFDVNMTENEETKKLAIKHLNMLNHIINVCKQRNKF